MSIQASEIKAPGSKGARTLGEDCVSLPLEFHSWLRGRILGHMMVRVGVIVHAGELENDRPPTLLFGAS